MSSKYKIILPRNERAGFTKARLNISVGQEYHEGDKFESLTTWVARHFNECVINICDSLQRHNLEASGISPSQAHKMAIANGDAWIERNKQSLENLPNVKLVRWDSWRSHPDWQNAKGQISSKYDNDRRFRTIADQTADAFLAKRHFSSDVDKQKAMDYSLRYILEEAAFSLISSYDDIADIYPGTFPPIFDYMRETGMKAPVSMTTVSFKKRTLRQQAA